MGAGNTVAIMAITLTMISLLLRLYTVYKFKEPLISYATGFHVLASSMAIVLYFIGGN